MSLEDAIDVLCRGDVVLLATDTLPGLHALATAPGAAQRLAALKGHLPDRPYLLLVDSADAAFALGQPADPAQEEVLRGLWPAPLTALLRPRPETPPEWTHEGRSVGIRVPGAPALCRLLGALPGPLYSTSANQAGVPAASDLDDAENRFAGLASVDLGFQATGGASTIVDFTVCPPDLVRSGVVPFDPVSGAWGPY